MMPIPRVPVLYPWVSWSPRCTLGCYDTHPQGAPSAAAPCPAPLGATAPHGTPRGVPSPRCTPGCFGTYGDQLPPAGGEPQEEDEEEKVPELGDGEDGGHKEVTWGAQLLSPAQPLVPGR